MGSYKPGFVRKSVDDHLSRATITGSLQQPTRNPNTRVTHVTRTDLCLVLHRMRLAVPLLSPEARWALTSPFHPYPCGRFVFCCAICRITAPGRYPAFYPAVPGLSSSFHRRSSTARGQM